MIQDVALLGISVDGSDLADARREMDRTGAAADRMESQVRGLGAGARRGFTDTGNSARRMGRDARAAAANVSNLGFQINDTIVVAAAGQNPLQTMVQQGTQFTQVVNQMGGGRQAIMGLKEALVQMVSPVSLLTLGAVGLSAAIVQFGIGALGAREEAETLEDVIANLGDSVDQYREYAQQARLTTSELGEEFGSAASAVQGFNRFLLDIDRVETLTELREAMTAVSEQFGGLSNATVFQDARGVAESTLTVRELEEVLSLTEEQAIAVGRALRDINQAGTTGELQDAVTGFNEAIRSAFSFDEIRGNEGLRELARQVQELGLAAAGIEGEFERLLDPIQDAYAAMGNFRQQSADSQIEAQALLADLEGQRDMLRLIWAFGEDSAEVSRARAIAEREAFVEMTNSRDISEQMKDELIAAFDAVASIANTDMASPIIAAAQAAAALAQNAAAARAAIYNGTAGPDAVIQGQYAADRFGGAAQTSAIEGIVSTFNVGPRVGSVGGRGSSGSAGGQSEAAREAERLDNERRREATRIIEDLRSATEVYNDELADLQELQELGYLTTDQFTAAQERLTEEFNQTRFEPILDGIQSLSDGLAQVIVDGSNLGDFFRRMLAQMAADLISSGIQSLLLQAFAPMMLGGGGGFGALLLNGFRSSGGDVNRGGVYRVGENGPETLIMGGRNGHIMSNSESMTGGMVVNVNNTYDMSGAIGADGVTALIAEHDRKLQRELPDQIRYAVQNPRAGVA